MGDPIDEFDNETRLVHFCPHFEIKDKMPESFDKVNGIWYVKEPAELGTKIPSTSATMTEPPAGVPTLVWSYFYRQPLADIGRGGKSSHMYFVFSVRVLTLSRQENRRYPIQWYLLLL